MADLAEHPQLKRVQYDVAIEDGEDFAVEVVSLDCVLTGLTTISCVQMPSPPALRYYGDHLNCNALATDGLTYHSSIITLADDDTTAARNAFAPVPYLGQHDRKIRGEFYDPKSVE